MRQAMGIGAWRHGSTLLPLLADVRQAPVERDAVAGHQVEPVDVEQLLHPEQLVRRDHHGLAVLTLVGSRVEHVLVQQLWNRRTGRGH